MIILAHAPRASVTTLAEELSASIYSLISQGIDCWEAHIVVCAKHKAVLRKAVGKSARIKWHTVQRSNKYCLDIRKLFQTIRKEWVGLMYAGDVMRADFMYWVLRPILTSDQHLEIVTYGQECGDDKQGIKRNSFIGELPIGRLAPDLHWESGYLDANLIVRKEFVLNQLSRYPIKGTSPLNIVRAVANRLVMPSTNQKHPTTSEVRKILLKIKADSYIRRRLQDSVLSKTGLVQDLDRLLKNINPDVKIAISDADKVWLQIDWPLPHLKPAVHIVIPTRDRLDLLKPCISSLLRHTEYPNYQVIVVDNGSVESETLRYLSYLPGRAAKKNIELLVIRDDGPFNFSALNNNAVRNIRDGIIIFLNNDIEIVDSQWLTQMVRQAMRPDIGCVGAQLLYPDETIQHLGVTLGATHIASHLFSTVSPKHWPSHNPLLKCTSNPIAVTAATMAIRAEVFHQLGGYNEDRLAVAYNDVDLCLRAEEQGYRTVCNPRSTLIHHESMSRKLNASVSKDTRQLSQDNLKARALKRERQESSWMRKRWSSQLALYPGNQSL